MSSDIEVLNNLIMKTEIIRNLLFSDDYNQIFAYLETEVKEINDYCKSKYWGILKSAINEILNNKELLDILIKNTRISIESLNKLVLRPRWINEIPGIKNTGKKRKLTKQEKKEVKEFRNAIKNDKIDEWFNKHE